MCKMTNRRILQIAKIAAGIDEKQVFKPPLDFQQFILEQIDKCEIGLSDHPDQCDEVAKEVVRRFVWAVRGKKKKKKKEEEKSKRTVTQKEVENLCWRASKDWQIEHEYMPHLKKGNGWQDFMLEFGDYVRKTAKYIARIKDPSHLGGLTECEFENKFGEYWADTVTDCFLLLYSKVTSGDITSVNLSYMYEATRNALTDQLRKYRKDNGAYQFPGEDFDPPAPMAPLDGMEDIFSAAGLNDEEKSVVTLWVFEENSWQETANELDRSEQEVKKFYDSAMRKIGLYFDKAKDDNPLWYFLKQFKARTEGFKNFLEQSPYVLSWENPPCATAEETLSSFPDLLMGSGRVLLLVEGEAFDVGALLACLEYVIASKPSNPQRLPLRLVDATNEEPLPPAPLSDFDWVKPDSVVTTLANRMLFPLVKGKSRGMKERWREYLLDLVKAGRVTFLFSAFGSVDARVPEAFATFFRDNLVAKCNVLLVGPHSISNDLAFEQGEWTVLRITESGAT